MNRIDRIEKIERWFIVLTTNTSTDNELFEIPLRPSLYYYPSFSCLLNKIRETTRT